MSLLARFSRIFAMYRSRLLRSQKATKDRTRSGPAIFDTFAIFECDRRVTARTPSPNPIAIRKVAGLGFASSLSAFSAMVQMISAKRYKLLLRLEIGDGALPKSAKKRQKAPFGGAIHGGRGSALNGDIRVSPDLLEQGGKIASRAFDEIFGQEFGTE
jgi:hypothetical protein